MEKTPSFLAFESLIDLSKKASIIKNREYEENEYFCFYRNFTYLSWYSRLNIYKMPFKDEKMLERIKKLCSEPASPKYLSLAEEDVYKGFDDDLKKAGFTVVKPQKGMLYDLKDAPDYETDKNIELITKKTLPEWITACENGFGKSNTSPAFNLFINDKNCYFYGYRENGKLVATALLNVCGTNGGIHEVATVNEYRNKGYATALIKHIIKESKKLGCDILSLQASVFGEPVYKKLGFNVVSSILNYKL